MSHKTFVTIIIPTFNRLDYLKKTLNSCRLQTHDCEIIIVDHGSNDGTKEYFQNNNHSDIKYIRKERDFGPIYAWLDGVLHANHDLVHLQFDDDLLKPDFIEKSISMMNENVGFVFCTAEMIDENGRLLQKKMYSNLYNSGIHLSSKIRKFLLKTMISPACILIRKKDLLDSLYIGKLPFQQIYHHGVGPDLFMTLLAISRYKYFAYINQPLAIFREHSSSITSQSHKNPLHMVNLQKSYDEVRRFYLSFHLQNNFFIKLYIFICLINPKNLYLLLNKIKNPKWQKLLNLLKKQYKK